MYMLFRSKFCMVIKVFASVIVCLGYTLLKNSLLNRLGKLISVFCLHWACSLLSCLLEEMSHEYSIFYPGGLRTRFQKWTKFPMQVTQQEFKNSVVIWQGCLHNLCLYNSLLLQASYSGAIKKTVLQMTLLVYVPCLSIHNFRLWQCYHACF